MAKYVRERAFERNVNRDINNNAGVAACYSNSNERRQRKIANSHVGGVSV
jgi:hypothetical protein